MFKFFLILAIAVAITYAEETICQENEDETPSIIVKGEDPNKECYVNQTCAYWIYAFFHDDVHVSTVTNTCVCPPNTKCIKTNERKLSQQYFKCLCLGKSENNPTVQPTTMVHQDNEQSAAENDKNSTL